MSLELNTLQSIGGKKAALVMDEIGLTSSFDDSILLQAVSGVHEHIWVRESAVAELRERHGDVAIYGLWQVLLHSGVVDLSQPVSVWRETESTGLYLAAEGGRAVQSGRYTLNQLPAEVGYGFADADIVNPRVEPASLRRPPARAMLVTDLVHQRRKRLMASAGIGGAAVLSIIVGAWLIDAFRVEEANRINQEVGALKAQISQVRAQESQVLSRANPIDREAMVRYRASFSRLAELQQRAPGFTMREARFDEPMWRGEISGAPLGLSFPVVLETVPGLPPAVAFSPTGEGEVE